MNSLGSFLSGFSANMTDSATLREENQVLREKVDTLTAENSKLVLDKEELERLQELLDLKEEYSEYDSVGARVISKGSGNWFNTFTIDKGTSSGIEEGMVAITEYSQVVGLVTEAGPNWATVTTVLDSVLGISASVASSGYTGKVEGALATGSEGLLRMNYLPTDSVLRNNDQVLTTGSTVYPRGLIIGYITDAGFDETGVAKYALLRPAADLDNLEQVFIITHYENN
jgi:rod shape-determining protein MreC